MSCILATDPDTRIVARERWPGGGFDRRAHMGETTVLVVVGQGSPSVPFVQLPVLPESVRGRVLPPDPVGVERRQPFPKEGSQLPVGVAREDEQRPEH